MATRAHRTAAIRFPPFPPILDFVTRALEDPTLDDRQVVQAIRSDEALTLGLLRYANSAWMAHRHAVASVAEALTVVGLAGLRSVALTQFSRSFFQQGGPLEEFLWEHALASAIAAALQHPGAGRATEELYLCGLLHNVGKAVLNAEQPAAYGEVVRRVVQRGEEFCEAERKILGVAHQTVGVISCARASSP